MSNPGAAIKGFYRDVLTESGRGVIYDSGWHSNTIVDNGRILLASFMKNDQSFTLSGVNKLVVGSGDPAWDTAGLPTQDKATQSDLVTPAADPPDPPLDVEIAFLEADGSHSTSPTNLLEITAVLEEGYPQPVDGSGLDSYPLREFGLFAEVDLGPSGLQPFMINWITHPVIHKGPTSSLIRVVRLHF